MATLNRPKQTLTTNEKRSVEIAKEMYLLIKTVDAIEKYYTFDKIDDQTYNQQMEKNINKYQKFKDQIPGFQLDKFIETYGLQNNTWAKSILTKGLQKQNQKETILILLTQKFINVLDLINVNDAQLLVKDFKTEYEELITLINKLDKKLNSLQQLEGFNQNYIKPKRLNDCLSENEKRDLLETVEQSQQEFGQKFGI